MLELLSTGLILGLKDKKIDLGELNEKALEEDSEVPPFAQDEGGIEEVVKTDAEEDVPPFFSQEEESGDDAPPFGGATAEEEPFAQPAAGVSGEAISQLEERVSEISDTVAKIESLVSGFDERISKIEKSMESLLSVYELVTNEINPFIGYSNGTENGNGREEKKKEEAVAVSSSSPGIALEEKVMDRRVVELKPNGDRVRLERINNDPNSLLLLFKWLDFLIKKAGYQGMIKTLLFYEEVGWITREVRDQIIKYSRDLGGTRASRGNRKLTVLEHIISLFFIIKLQGLEVSPTLYSEVVNQLDESGIV
ncbi:FlaD/FlaE family flagellar protein [Candidatus Pyrohabitans sp.]